VFAYDPSTTDESIGTTAYTVTTNTTDWYTIDATTGQFVFTPTIGGSWWFDIMFDDFSGVANATVNQNFTITVPALPLVIPPSNNPSVPNPISVSFQYVIDGNSVYFSDNSHGDGALYIWDFGDGKGSSQRNPKHDYSTAGIYEVTLTVYDSDGNPYSLTTRIKIGIGSTVSQDESGWSIRLTDELLLKVSAIGLLVIGGVMFASAVYMPSSSFVITTRGRKVIGILMVGASVYFYLFIDNSWWGG
jgi:PKD repeat protein